MNDYDKNNIGTIMTDPEADWFTAHLFRLIAKADRGNLYKLGTAFPDEVIAVCQYLGKRPPDTAAILSRINDANSCEPT